MFWVMMYMLLFGNAADPSAAMLPDAKGLKRAVTDPVRREQVLAVHKKAERIEKDRRRAEQDVLKALAALNRRHDAAPEEFEALFATLDASRRTAQAGRLDARFAMKEHMKRKEWDAVFNIK